MPVCVFTPPVYPRVTYCRVAALTSLLTDRRTRTKTPCGAGLPKKHLLSKLSPTGCCVSVCLPGSSQLLGFLSMFCFPLQVAQNVTGKERIVLEVEVNPCVDKKWG